MTLYCSVVSNQSLHELALQHLILARYPLFKLLRKPPFRWNVLDHIDQDAVGFVEDKMPLAPFL